MNYRITNVQERNEWGDGMKDYAIALEGEQGWIKLTQKVMTRPPEVGQEIAGTIETKQDRNAKPYRKFTKERANGFGGDRTSQSPSQEAYIVQMLEELTGRREVGDVVHKPEASKEPELEDPFAGIA